MKKLNNRTISMAIVLVLIISSLFVLSACTSSMKYRNGFKYNRRQKAIICATKSKEDVFDVNAVTLDFYFGWSREQPAPSRNPYYSFELVCVAVYFAVPAELERLYNERTPSADDHRTTPAFATDYLNAEGYHFVKEFSVDEFYADSFRAKSKSFGGNTFEHHETLSVPKELFARRYKLFDVIPNGSFQLFIMTLAYVRRLPPLQDEVGWDGEPYEPDILIEEGYHSLASGSLRINYEFIDDNTIKLTK